MNSETDNQQYRFEKKFWIDGMSKMELESYVKQSKAFFSEIFYERTINNIYFDTPFYRSYQDNVIGNLNRTKVRIRWYEDLFQKIDTPILEFKIKRGEVGKKQSYKLKPLTFNENISKEMILDIFEKSDLPSEVLMELKTLNPVLVNRYSRKYFQSENGKFRTTIDSNLRFLNIKNKDNNFKKEEKLFQPIILELKYNLDDAKGVENVSQGFPFRVTKSSKYVTGINLLNLVGY